MDLLQRVMNYIQAEETDSSALKNQIELLKKELQDSQEEACASKVSMEHLEFEAQQLRYDSKVRIEIIQDLQQQLTRQTFKFQLEEKALKEAKKSHQKKIHKFESNIQDSIKLNQKILEQQGRTMNELTKLQEGYDQLALLEKERSFMSAGFQGVKIESDNSRNANPNTLSDAFKAKCNDYDYFQSE